MHVERFIQSQLLMRLLVIYNCLVWTTIRNKSSTRYEMGYLLNDASSEDVVQAIKLVARGEAVCPPKLCMFLFRHFAATCGNRLEEDAHGLTMRQRQLMDLVSKGLSNKEIAIRLNLSQFTVKNHIRRILQNVDAETRYQAVDVMRARGILPLSP